MENEFPPNSHNKAPARRERPNPEKGESKDEVQRVTRGKVVQRKKPLRRKLLDAFKPEDVKDTVEHGIMEMLIPGIKDLVADTASSAIESALGVNGGGRNYRRRGGGGSGYTSYSSMGGARPDRSRRGGRDDDKRDRRERRSAASDLNEIIVDTRVEANVVIDSLFEILSKYDSVTVKDLLVLVGEPHTYTDGDWGWTDLRGARIHGVREGYLLDLPRPIPLD